jgi:hypothetical protein
MRTGREFVLVQPVYRLKRAEKQSKLTGSDAALPQRYQANTAAAVAGRTAVLARAGQHEPAGGGGSGDGTDHDGRRLFTGLPEATGPFAAAATGTVNLAAVANTNPFDPAVTARLRRRLGRDRVNIPYTYTVG